jgi:hypothetical protein
MQHLKPASTGCGTDWIGAGFRFRNSVLDELKATATGRLVAPSVVPIVAEDVQNRDRRSFCLKSKAKSFDGLCSGLSPLAEIFRV